MIKMGVTGGKRGDERGRRVLKVGVTGGIGSGKSTVCEMFASLGAPVYCSDARAREIMNEAGDVRRAIVELLGPGAYLDAADGEGRHEAGNGMLDSAYVASKVFNDRELLAELNAIVHPAVALDFERWAADFEHWAADFAHPATRGDCADHAASGDCADHATRGECADHATRGDCADHATRGNCAAPVTRGEPADCGVPPGLSTPPSYVVLESAILLESGFDALVDRIVTVSAPVEVRVERVMARDKNITREQALRRMASQLTDPEREARADHRIDNSGSREELARQVQLIDNQLKTNR